MTEIAEMAIFLCILFAMTSILFLSNGFMQFNNYMESAKNEIGFSQMLGIITAHSYAIAGITGFIGYVIFSHNAFTSYKYEILTPKEKYDHHIQDFKFAEILGNGAIAIKKSNGHWVVIDDFRKQQE